MMTVKEVSDLTGVSIRTLRYYDRIGLLCPSAHTQAGYRLYDEEALRELEQILLFRELEFPLEEIRAIMKQPDFDRQRALEHQIGLLRLRKERLEKLIEVAEKMKDSGGTEMDFSAFDTEKLEEYARRAKEEWGTTDAYAEYAERTKGWSREDFGSFASDFMHLFAEFGKLKDGSPADPAAQAQVKKLQKYITDHMYRCTDEILQGLGTAYGAGGEFTENIDRAGGRGTGKFASEAIRIYCEGK